MALKEDILAAQQEAVRRVIKGGMREDLASAQVIAGEGVKIAEIARTRQKLWDAQPKPTSIAPDPEPEAF